MFSGTTQPSNPWPALEYETLPWAPRAEPGTASRSQLRRQNGTYQAAIAPAISQLRPLLPMDVEAAASDAIGEIGRFDAEVGGEIAPFQSVLLRSEAAASSQIERLTASARAIAEAELPGVSGTGNAPLIVANTRAMNAAIQLADRLDVDAVLEMHNELLRDSDPDVAGRWRTEQVWIGNDDLGPLGADFVPPQHSRIAGAMADLVEFIQRDDLPVLVQAAVAHAQFETIHPFVDGNGRTGRALIHSLLKGKGLTRNVTIPVSAGLLTDVDSYFAALTAYRSGDPGPIVGRVTAAAFAAIDNGRQLVGDLRQIRSRWATEITARRDSRVHTVADLILRQPVVNAQYLADRLGIAQPNVYPLIDQLVAAGILTPTSDRRRGRTWRSTEVISALDGFARRAGRRHRPQT